MKKKQIIQLARELRKNTTLSEKLLWKYLRKRQLKGMKFLRQYPILYDNINDDYNFFIADFYCHEKKLIIELDGNIHKTQKEYDNGRDYILKTKSYQVLRIKNHELNNITIVLNKIEELFQTNPPQPSLNKGGSEVRVYLKSQIYK